MPKHYKNKKEKREPVPGVDKFTTEAEALDRADELGCEGAHSMDEDGQVIYMPCSTHAAYDAIAGGEMADYSRDEIEEPARGLPDSYRPATRPDVPEGQACGTCFFFNEEDVAPDGRARCMKWREYVEGGFVCNSWKAKDETRPYHDEEDDEEDRQEAEPAPKSEQIEGSDTNEPGSAGGAGGDIEFSEATETGLRNKVRDHNEAMEEQDKPAYTRTTYGQLAAVYRRGSGAFSVSHRPGISRAAWSMARVNAFLYLLRNGRPENAAYVGDNDLLPEGHPKSTRSLVGVETRQVELDPPAYFRASARRGLELHADGKSGDGLVDSTIREARAMAAGNMTSDKWVRTRAFIARHLVDMDAPRNTPGNDDYPGPGAVAMMLWGGGGSKRSAERALAYADGVVVALEEENEGRARGEALSKLETRVYNIDQFEVREDGDGMELDGYAVLFDSQSENLGGFTETVRAGAFSSSLKARNDIKLLWNHETGAVLGSTRAGTLSLVEDERGLKVNAKIAPTSYGRDAAILIKRGDVTGFSFGFSMPARGGDEWNSEGTERVLKSVRLHEVSLTPFPAYQATNGTASVRGLDKIALRAGVDADALADALLKVENGEDISGDDRNLLHTVIDELSPEAPAALEADTKGLEMLALKKKKLQLLMES